MATFEVKVVKIEIEPHPNADKLECAVIGDYRAIVGKGQFKSGDLVVYIPEASIVPDWLIERMGLVGKLAGKAKNRVKAIRLRQALSQGLVYPVEKISNLESCNELNIVRAQSRDVYVIEGQDIQTELGITKYEPPIPTCMSGEVAAGHGYTINYDIENVKKWNSILIEDELIAITEKLHGTWTCFGQNPNVPHVIITSKGLSKQGLYFKLNEQNANNLYIRMHRQDALNHGGQEIQHRVGQFLESQLFEQNYHTFYVLGETLGQGVQDLHYGQTQPTFRLFDVYVGAPNQGRFLNDSEKQALCEYCDIPRVPVLYRGPYSKEIVDKLTNGKETLSGTGSNIREGIVITPIIERYVPNLGRVILKSVSEAYLFRGKDDEVTEYA